VNWRWRQSLPTNESARKKLKNSLFEFTLKIFFHFNWSKKFKKLKSFKIKVCFGTCFHKINLQTNYIFTSGMWFEFKYLQKYHSALLKRQKTKKTQAVDWKKFSSEAKEENKINFNFSTAIIKLSFLVFIEDKIT
jgi:hypothetical protein